MRCVYDVWIPGWAFEITRQLNGHAPDVRHALLKASAEDKDMRDAIYAAVKADAWDVALDLLPESERSTT